MMAKVNAAIIYNSEGDILDVIAVSSIPIADICQQLLPGGASVLYLEEEAKTIEDELGKWQVIDGSVELK